MIKPYRFEYDIAISFAGEDRNIAQQIALVLAETYGLKIFYDDYEQARLAGQNLTEYLIDIYKNKARYCLILISKFYYEKRWTRHEWRAVQARAFNDPDIVYTIPIRIDDTDLPGLLETVGFLSLKKLTIPQVTNTIYNMVSSEVEKLNRLRAAQEYYANGKYDETLRLVKDNNFDKDVEALRIRGNVYGKLQKYEEAINEFHKILQFLPSDFMALFHLGIFYYRIGDFKNSVFYYEAASKIYPHHPTILGDLPSARKKLKSSVLKRFRPYIYIGIISIFLIMVWIIIDNFSINISVK